MSVVFVNGSSIHYESLGRGRPVVFLHGWIGTWRYWVPSMQLTAVSHSAYALDLLGFGHTARKSDEYTIDGQARMVLGFLDEMGIDKVAVVGHGLGALVALLLVDHAAARVDRVLGVALPFDLSAVDSTLHEATTAELFTALAGTSSRAEELRNPSPEPDPLAQRAPLDMDQISSAVGTMRENAVPCLLIYGAEDPLIRPPSLAIAASLGARVHQLVLDASGHFPMLEVADVFNRLLIDFLALEGGASPAHIQPKEEWRRRMR